MTVGVSLAGVGMSLPVHAAAPSTITNSTTTTTARASLNILAFGDSLTAGYQIDPKNAFPNLLKNELQKTHPAVDVNVLNAGVSGNTSAQGLRRVDWTLKKGPFDVVIVCLGSNDGLQLLPLDALEKNLNQMVTSFQKTGARVILVGMKLPTNEDATYRKNFEAIFPRVAKSTRATLVPFLLERVAAHSELNLRDGVHPNEKGHQLIAEMLLPTVKTLSESALKSRSAH